MGMKRKNGREKSQRSGKKWALNSDSAREKVQQKVKKRFSRQLLFHEKKNLGKATDSAKYG